jgi:flavin reductase (DIM6/NTAB) family NADH-FMN oxidoreductase RutF
VDEADELPVLLGPRDRAADPGRLFRFGVAQHPRDPPAAPSGQPDAEPRQRDAPAKVSLGTDKRGWRPSPLPGQIVLVTSIDAAGTPNVAPKSWISMVAMGPPAIVMVGCRRDHRTARNIEATGEFVINVPPAALAERVWTLIDQDPGVDRFTRGGFTPIPAERVSAPRIAECRAHLECRLEGTQAWGLEVTLFGRIVAASVDAAAAVGTPEVQYGALAPCFFLEDRLTAPLGKPRQIVEG